MTGNSESNIILINGRQVLFSHFRKKCKLALALFIRGGGIIKTELSTLNEKGDMKDMKNLRSYLAFTLAIALVLSSAVVFATELISPDMVALAAEGDDTTDGDVESGDVGNGDDEEGTISGNTTVSGNTTSSGGGAAGGGSSEQAAAAEAHREAVRLEAEAAATGFENAAQMQEAQAANKTAGEYYNNAVLSTPGIEEATPVAQGGNLVVNGQVTNMTASIAKVTGAYVASVRAAQVGTVLNVVNVQFPATAAVINFYMPGVTDGANIAAVQYTNGAWVDVEVVEARADHVVLNLQRPGVVAFIAK